MGPFATATEFCSFTGMSMPSDLARLQGLLDDASAEIRGFTGQTLSQATETVSFLAQTGSLIVLEERPVTAIASVVIATVTQDPSTYIWTTGGHLWHADATAWPAVSVTYTHGYLETEPEFARLRTICIQIASRAYTLNERSASEAMGSTLMESAGYSPEIFLTEGEKERLSDYRSMVMA